MDDWILHVDLDQFLAAVEILRRPELAGSPGRRRRRRRPAAGRARSWRRRRTRRGRSVCGRACRLAWPPASARTRCSSRRTARPTTPRPPGDGDAAVVPRGVEVWGWDEAFVGRPHRRPRGARPRVQARVLAETGLTCAVGIGETKLQAKTATGFAKPGGVARLTRQRRGSPTMGDRPVTALWGIGGRTARRLAELGIRTVVDLAAADHRRAGPPLRPDDRAAPQVLGLGGDDSPVVDEPHVPRSRSREVTFERDLTEPGRDRRPRRPAGRRGDRVGRRRGAAGHPRRRQGAHGDVLHPHQDQQAARSRRPTRRMLLGPARVVLERFETPPGRLLGVRVVLELPA